MTSPEPDISSLLAETQEFTEETDNPDLHVLTQAWLNEKSAPELLPFQGIIVEDLIELLESQASIANELSTQNVNNAFIAMLYQTEMERVKYLIRSYLRTRLSKIEKDIFYIMKNEEYAGRLSDAELRYAQMYHDLLESHFRKSCLDSLPAWMQRLDDRTSDLNRTSNMINPPDLERAVFCRVKENIGEFQLSENASVVLDVNNIFILRYCTIQNLLAEQKVELI
ncbi:GINS complex subunit [Basidiobolus ranarum]|uniref:DNA replication complex GINS protein SLD5 n=1 Tax=Basidiobolus ranarum TaxID=34480 RepID=A0ABR2VZK8_9FUNG